MIYFWAMARLKSRRSTRSDSRPGWARSLGDAVRRRRKALKLTQAELARLAGCGPVFIFAVEHAKPTVRLGKLVDVLQVLGLELVIRPGQGAIRAENGA